MGLKDIINAMQTLHAAVDGIKTAPQMRAYPAKIEPVVCPIVMTWPGGGEWDEAAVGGGLGTDWETLTISVYIAPVSLGYRGETIVQATDLIDAFRPLYLSYLGITTISGTVEQIEQTKHSGLIQLLFADIAFYGFQITVPALVKEILP